MSEIKHQQLKILSQFSSENQEYINKLQTNDEICLSSIYNSNIEIQVRSKNKNYKNNVEFDFIKLENISLQSLSNSQNELKIKYTEQNNIKIKNESMESITHLNNKNISDDFKLITINNEINKEDMKDNNIPIKVKKGFVFEKNIFSQLKDKSYNYEIKNENLNDENNDPETKFITSINQNKIKINSLIMLNKQVKSCNQCSMTFRYKRHLDRHLEGHQKNNCSHCNAKFARRKHLDIHLFRSHGERVTKYPYSCDVCSRSFPKRILLNRHRAKHNYENGKVCSDCGEMLKTEEDDKKHKENYCIRKQFKCKKCLQTFNIEQTYTAHIQNHNNHKCSKCDVTFASKKKVHEHYKMVHSSKLNHNQISNGIYFCADCRNTFLKKDDYSRHLNSTSHLNKINKEISQRNIFICLICSKKLISQRALDQHVRRIHKKEKRFTCNIYGCTFQCARKSDLDRHKQLHIEQRNIICEQCGKTFTSVSILNDHVLYIHNKERQFICEECGKAFKRNSLLKRHKLSHQQYRPFVCMQCSTAFKRSHHLSRHMETCHRITLFLYPYSL